MVWIGKPCMHMQSMKIICLIVLLFLSSCGKKDEPKLLIYCGVTMIRPMKEIAKIIEARENCTIEFRSGGSGNLFREMKETETGDLYLPGSDSYIKRCLEDRIIQPDKTCFVGYNQAAMMVQKGNPLKIPASLDSLLNENYRVVLGNPTTGSIGRETKTILTKRGIYDGTIANARQLTKHSTDMIPTLRKGECDLIINWYASATWKENEPYVDVLPIEEKYASKKRLVIGRLKYSRHPEITQKFMQYAVSKEGRKLFVDGGLNGVPQGRN